MKIDIEEIKNDISNYRKVISQASQGGYNYSAYPVKSKEEVIELCADIVSATDNPKDEFFVVLNDDHQAVAMTGHGNHGKQNAEYIAWINPVNLTAILDHLEYFMNEIERIE